MRRSLGCLTTLRAIATCVPGNARAQASQNRDIILATTTSLYDTGLLDSLAPLFEHETGYHLHIVAVGSGQALRMGERGDADVLLVHSPGAEQAFVQAGHAGRRLVVATNYFTIVGPPDDPAGGRAAPTAAAALRRIAATGAVFVSRGDSSGTHQRELQLWHEGGARPEWTGYLESGQGMSITLLIAEERRGYTLTDRATYAALRDRLSLAVLRDRERGLLNVYHVIEVNPEGRPRVNAGGARVFADWIVSPAVQDRIAIFGARPLGEPLFVPARGREPEP